MISDAIEMLRAGKLVAFPTETVYGLGADATDATAIRRIFAAKGRPSTNPLICHVSDESMARRYALEWPASASLLAKAFWPGPLTIVVKKTSSIPPEATAGRETVGLRAPNHPLTLELLRGFGKPIAGPSANKSNRISPTTAQHVREELGDAVDLILDGGACLVGIESTVVDLTGDRPMVLRPGSVSREAIEAVIGPVAIFVGSVPADLASAGPGMQARHYAPRTPAIRFESTDRNSLAGDGCGAIVLAALRGFDPQVVMPNDPTKYARDFYAVLRRLDGKHLRQIAIELPTDEPAWAAVRDRITRATTKM